MLQGFVLFCFVLNNEHKHSFAFGFVLFCIWQSTKPAEHPMKSFQPIFFYILTCEKLSLCH